MTENNPFHWKNNESVSCETPYAEVIGHPIGQSLSPVIHGFWADTYQLDIGYFRANVPPEELGDYFAARKADPLWRGCNVTIPHKLAILDHIHDPDDMRGTIGAANMVFRDEAGELQAGNSDIFGFARPLLAISDDWSGKKAAVMGAGGAARAVLYALKKLNFTDITIIARKPFKAMGLLAEFGIKGQVINDEAPLPKAYLLVNATPLGMVGHEGEYTPDVRRLGRNAIVYDLVYNPLITPLLEVAENAGLDIIDGLAMFIGQAEISFELFFGTLPDGYDDERLYGLLLAQMGQ